MNIVFYPFVQLQVLRSHPSKTAATVSHQRPESGSKKYWRNAGRTRLKKAKQAPDDRIVADEGVPFLLHIVHGQPQQRQR